MTEDDFFEHPREQSLVKTTIVRKYFSAWANVMINNAKRFKKYDRIAYLDLFSGPGRFEDGAPSTPLEILQTAIANPDLSEMLITYFNDVNPDYSRQLETEINTLEGIEKLKFKPRVYSREVGEEVAKSIESIKFSPTLSFIDPWGYKGLSIRLITPMIRDWGCDCIFFFNYNRIRAALNNPLMKNHVDAIFGEQRVEQLRDKVSRISSEEAERTILDELCQAIIQETRVKNPLPFRFKTEFGTRTSHYLIFVSKHPLGYKIMKEIMASESSENEQGVPSFEYSPASERQPVLFGYSHPLDELEKMLLDEFAGLTLTMGEIFERHNYEKRYVEKNYREALIKLEADGTIATDPPASARPKRKGMVTFGPNTKVTFPPKGK